jgi:hypothetical protein
VTVTYQDVLAEAGAGGSDEALATRVLAEANVHVPAYIAEALLDATKPVPTAVLDAATLRCAVDLFARAKAPFGTQILPDGSGQMVAQRLGADPLGGVYSLLRPWAARVGLG